MFEFDLKVYAALAAVIFLMALPVLHRKFYGSVPAINASELLKQGNRISLIDLRSAHAFQSGHIKDSINIPSDQMQLCKQQLFELLSSTDDNCKTALICDTDLISTKLCKQLLDMGIENVVVLKGGFNFWKRKHLPIVKG